jgi:predicted  nucleic acid-binding Zn ribbon protein
MGWVSLLRQLQIGADVLSEITIAVTCQVQSAIYKQGEKLRTRIRLFQ